MAKQARQKKQAKPKLTDKEQSERFIETARELRIEGAADKFEEIFKNLVPPKISPR